MRPEPLLSAWCPRCREPVAFRESGRCLWCSEQTGGAAPAPDLAGRRSHAGKPYLMDEAVLFEARTLYASGLSLRAVARELHPRTAYRSPDSLRAALEIQFRYRGWKLRRREAATRVLRHGLAGRDRDNAAYRRWLRASRRVACAGVRTCYPRKGEPCRRAAVPGSDFCISHDPARAAWRAEHLAAARARIGAA